ncbi:MAG: hypothetical protein GKC10_05400 [Methanosarcinales archaeon]|nr:hypothetical protein [Methanosarcinales archaeon]
MLTVFLTVGIAFSENRIVDISCNPSEEIDLQQVIDGASPGDTIEIYSGTYRGNLNLTRPLVLRGVDSGSGKPVVQGDGSGPVITISGGGATVEGLVVKGSGHSHPGVLVTSNGNSLLDNDISYQGRDGIFLDHASNNLIQNNVLSYNGRSGVYLKGSNNNIISENVLGINAIHGIYLDESSSNTLKANQAAKNKKGIYLQDCSGNLLLENMLEGNVDQGVRLLQSSSNNITGNNASYNYDGISLSASGNNLITENQAWHNRGTGIYLGASSQNLVYGNVLMENGHQNAFDNGDSNRWHLDGRGNRYGDFDQAEENCSDIEGDLICDRAYPIPGGPAEDLYPLTGTYRKGFLLVEVWTHQNGTLVEGTAFPIMIDFPTYDVQEGSLSSVYPLELEPDAILLVGEGSSLSGDLGGGAASGLSQISALPFQSGNVTILAMEEDRVTVEFRGQQRTLAPGEEWVEVDHELQRFEEGSYKVEITTTIHNYGRVRLTKW